MFYQTQRRKTAKFFGSSSKNDALRFCVFAFNKIIERKSGKYLEYFIKLPTFATANAEIAQLVEHNLAKVGVASSSLVFRSSSLKRMPGWWNR